MGADSFHRNRRRTLKSAAECVARGALARGRVVIREAAVIIAALMAPSSARQRFAAGTSDPCSSRCKRRSRAAAAWRRWSPVLVMREDMRCAGVVCVNGPLQ
eukprot:8345279-Pyramimonas_sp.AAC.2